MAGRAICVDVGACCASIITADTNVRICGDSVVGSTGHGAGVSTKDVGLVADVAVASSSSVAGEAGSVAGPAGLAAPMGIIRSRAEGKADIAEKICSVCSVGLTGRAVVSQNCATSAVFIAICTISGCFRECGSRAGIVA